jgi:hypothetical protein
MEKWHFNVIFMLGVIGALAMLFGPKIGLEVRPEVAGVFGLIIAFILKQRDDAVEEHKERKRAASEAGDPMKEDQHGQ